MPNELMLIHPGANKYDEQESLVKMREYVQKSRKFLKVAKGYSDEYMNKMKLKDLQSTLQKASDEITIGRFGKWADETIENPHGFSYIRRFLRGINSSFHSFSSSFKKKRRY